MGRDTTDIPADDAHIFDPPETVRTPVPIGEHGRDPKTGRARFGKGNKFAQLVHKTRVARSAIEEPHYQILVMLKSVLSQLRMRKMEPARAQAMIQPLRLRLELTDRFETNKLIESYRSEIRMLREHVMAMLEDREAKGGLQ